MKKFTVFIFAFVAAAVSAAAQPVLKIDKNAFHDWGTVKPSHSPLNCEFKLFNKGNKPLIIKKLEPDCSCTTAPLDKETIEPGDSATVKITVKLNDNTGEMHKRVQVITNIEGPDSVQIINMKALVIPSITFFPRRAIKFGIMQTGETATSKLIMTNETDKDITIKDIELTQDLKINIKNGFVLKARQEFELITTVTPTVSGNFSGIVTFSTSDPDTPYVKIFAYANVFPASTGDSNGK